ncbi:MAG: NADH-quinone oxidoreductase subunit N [Terrimicrobiaceae bacterium]|nr:NADH-quinone oxidoreductase subunit N [Terrimicrobiaceae bacterium]
MIPSFPVEFYVLFLGVVLLLADAFFPSMDKRNLAYIAIVWLAGFFVAGFFLQPTPLWGGSFGFYTTDDLGIFFKRFALIATILTLILSIEYAPVVERLIPGSKPGAGLGEFFILPVFTCAGLMWMASAADFVMIFCSLELVTISFYIQVAYMRKSPASLEAGTKYLILGALSTGFLVYGITWIFGITGQTGLRGISMVLGFVPVAGQTALLFGIGLVLVALGFKVAAAPFQFWVPDVYQGAPTPVTAFLSVGSKAAGFVVLMRVIEPFLAAPAIEVRLIAALQILAGLTLIYGNLAAMPQTNLKRLLGYSSIAHAGYLLVGVASVAPPPHFVAGPIVFYLVAYLLMTFLAFLVLIPVAKATGGDDIAHFNGLGRRDPVLALTMLISMLSLAGLPFTVGFLGKFFIFEAAMREQHYVLVAIGLVTVACGFYYYLKVVRAMYWQPAPADAVPIVVSPLTRFAAAFLAALILIIGIFPKPVLQILP